MRLQQSELFFFTDNPFHQNTHIGMTLLKLDVVFAGLKSGTKFSIVAVLNKDSIGFIYQCLTMIFNYDFNDVILISR